MPRYQEVNWEQASCKGVPTDLFYAIEESRHVNKFIDVAIIRRICMGCPIVKKCLAYAVEHEIYGMWGGLLSQERKAIVRREPSVLKSRAEREYAAVGIEWSEVQEAINEYQDYVRRLENEASD